MNEEQNISSGQDWTTTISGHLVLIGGEDDTLQKKSWDSSNTVFPKTYIEPWWWNDSEGEVERLPQDIQEKEPIKAKDNTGFQNPLMGNIRTSGGEWGDLRGSKPANRHHQGIDLKAKTGTNLFAPADGTVEKSEWGVQKSNGKWSPEGGKIIIKHKIDGHTYRTMYCHLHARHVSEGDDVVQGQHFADTGGDPNVDPPSKFGRTEGPHLHYQIWDYGKATGNKTTTWSDGNPAGAEYSGGSYTSATVDPRHYLNFDRAITKSDTKDKAGETRSQGGGGYAASCFISGTLVTMEDGTQKTIESIKVGEKVQGHSRINKVLKLDPVLLRDRKLFSFNGGKYFVTSDHPFLTTKGWKSLSPQNTLERDGIDVYNELVGALKEGDILITVKGEETLTSISSKEMNAPNTPLYNFYLDGDHSYSADNYFAHNK